MQFLANNCSYKMTSNLFHEGWDLVNMSFMYRTGSFAQFKTKIILGGN